MAGGCSLAAARIGTADERAWTAAHRARCATLGLAALAHAYWIWPDSRLPAMLLAALLISSAVRDQTSRPGQGAITVGCVALMLGIAEPWLWADYLMEAGQTWTDRFAISNPWYDEWESASFAGDWAAQQAVRTNLWRQALEHDLPMRDIWQAAAGLFWGLWWYRAGRHRETARRWRWHLVAGGLMMNATAAWTATATPWNEPGLAMQMADWMNYTGGAAAAAGTVMAATGAPTTNWQTADGVVLQRLGRRSLSAYLVATVAGAWVAHGWGLSLHGQLNTEQQAATVLAVATATIALCGLWGETSPGPRRTVVAPVDNRRDRDGEDNRNRRARAEVATSESLDFGAG